MSEVSDGISTESGKWWSDSDSPPRRIRRVQIWLEKVAIRAHSKLDVGLNWLAPRKPLVCFSEEPGHAHHWRDQSSRLSCPFQIDFYEELS
jgi:hypothetical protein